jgi:hypothetical protein
MHHASCVEHHRAKAFLLRVVTFTAGNDLHFPFAIDCVLELGLGRGSSPDRHGRAQGRDGRLAYPSPDLCHLSSRSTGLFESRNKPLTTIWTYSGYLIHARPPRFSEIWPQQSMHAVPRTSHDRHIGTY